MCIRDSITADGEVAFEDFLTLSRNFGDEVVNHTLGDLDCDGTVSFPDFLTLSQNFGDSVGDDIAASVPEPSSITLLCLAGLLLGRVRRCESS